MNRSFIKYFAASLLLLVASFVFRYFLLGGIYPTNLSDAPETAGSISLDIPPSSGKVAIYGKDFKNTNEKFFENKKWAVVSFKNSEGLAGSVVLKNVNGAYLIVAGPGTQLSNSLQSSLPDSVNEYLIESGLING